VKSLSIVIAVASLAAAPARAQAPFYYGAWVIEGAVKAPWADPAHPLDPAEPARLRGRVITIAQRGISGPLPFPCPHAHYRLVDDPPDMLFQGAFGEMRARDHVSDPRSIAQSLGFHGAAARTLETGCEFDFHFVDERQAQTGLNDFIYRLRKR
jgi:hypothetical protein